MIKFPPLPSHLAYIRVGKTMAVVDAEDFASLSQFSWSLFNGYARARVDGKVMFMHRMVNKTPEGMDTDHINFCRLDNRRCNLRTVTRSENSQRKLRKPVPSATRKYLETAWSKDSRFRGPSDTCRGLTVQR